MANKENTPQTFYVLKVKGKAKIPDYIQVRDAQFTLIGYFRPGRGGQTGRTSDPYAELMDALEARIHDIPYGIITPIQL